MRRALLALLAASGTLAVPATTAAYTVRKSDAGAPVHWTVDTVEVVLDRSLDRLDDGARGAIARAFGTWNAADDALPGAVTVDGDADEVGYRPGGTNHSTVRFARKGSKLAGGALAVTVLTFDSAGTILDADVVINGGGSRRFACLGRGAGSEGEGEGDDHDDHGEAGGSSGRYDVQNVVTHEVGHFFGLGEEEQLADATMFVSSARGETKKRDLSADDEEGVRSLYEGVAKPAVAGCSTQDPRSPAPLAGLPLWGALAAVGLLARRRRHGKPSAGAGRATVPIAAALGLALAAPTGCGGVPDAPLGEGDATVEIRRVDSRWVDGVVVSTLELAPVACRGPACPAGVVSVELLGGTVDGLTQIVGHSAVPEVGDRVPLTLDDRGWRLPRRWASPSSGDATDGHAKPTRERPDAPRIAEKAAPAARVSHDPRRVHARSNVATPVLLRWNGLELRGTTENLSEGGVFVACEDAEALPAPGSSVALELELDGGGPTRLVGEVRWRRSASDDGSEPAGCGIRFVAADGDAAARVRALVVADPFAS